MAEPRSVAASLRLENRLQAFGHVGMCALAVARSAGRGQRHCGCDEPNIGRDPGEIERSVPVQGDPGDERPVPT